jgi:hypothetical protein
MVIAAHSPRLSRSAAQEFEAMCFMVASEVCLGSLIRRALAGFFSG